MTNMIFLQAESNLGKLPPDDQLKIFTMYVQYFGHYQIDEYCSIMLINNFCKYLNIEELQSSLEYCIKNGFETDFLLLILSNIQYVPVDLSFLINNLNRIKFFGFSNQKIIEIFFSQAWLFNQDWLLNALEKLYQLAFSLSDIAEICQNTNAVDNLIFIACSYEILYNIGFKIPTIVEIAKFEWGVKNLKTLIENYTVLSQANISLPAIIYVVCLNDGSDNIQNLIDDFKKLLTLGFSVANIRQISTGVYAGWFKIRYVARYFDELTAWLGSRENILNIIGCENGLLNVSSILNNMHVLFEIGFNIEQLIVITGRDNGYLGIDTIVANKEYILQYKFKPEDVVSCLEHWGGQKDLFLGILFTTRDSRNAFDEKNNIAQLAQEDKAAPVCKKHMKMHDDEDLLDFDFSADIFVPQFDEILTGYKKNSLPVDDFLIDDDLSNSGILKHTIENCGAQTTCDVGKINFYTL